MKKLIIILVVVCLVFAGVIGYITVKNVDTSPTEPQTTPDETPVETSAAIEQPMVDYDKLYASRNSDDVVAKVGGKDVTWDEYFYWLYNYCNQVENYFSTIGASTGTAGSWTDNYNDETTFAEYVTELTANSIKQVAAIESVAEDNQVTLSDEDKAALATQLENDISSYFGEGGTEEEFFKRLQEDAYLSRNMYERMNNVNYLYQNGFVNLYGENGELVDDAAALAYLTDKGYMSANHILLMTADMTSGTALDETTIAEKKAKAQEIDDELKAITDKDALLSRFAELKAEYCEDTGKTQYPDGYTFLPGTMVEEFENAGKALAEYGVSDVIETSYGYHILLRLPLDPDAVIEYSSAGTPLNARQMMANEEYGEKIQSKLDSLTMDFEPGFQIPDINDYVQ